MDIRRVGSKIQYVGSSFIRCKALRVRIVPTIALAPEFLELFLGGRNSGTKERMLSMRAFLWEAFTATAFPESIRPLRCLRPK
ncbi:hypothetical protein SAMN05661091_1195 [Paenibacillus uliginis N3/975]|uniref:Uncharacterized protein n=1 Tax=Paenibacillus uliginis N3/975 TaxID=1313296 RepID=A0A1X7GVN4_9BACL|nr:hypothetical protein SAMN05661091_1195 [Paenibacillus uliginis N3/975]